MLNLLKKWFVSKFAFISIALFLMWVGIQLQGGWVVLSAFFICLSIISQTQKNNSKSITILLSITTVIATVDYFTWRSLVTNWQDWWISTPLLAAEMLGAIHVVGQQFTLWPQQQQVLYQGNESTRLPIYILIPTVNEPLDVLTATLQGALEAKKAFIQKYPYAKVSVVICKDGMQDPQLWEQTKNLAQQLGVVYITRTVGGGAKAGNLEYARRQLLITGNSLIVLFDADQVAKSDFLIKTIPYFSDAKVGWVQTGQYYHNLDNPVAAWADDQQALFYKLLCPGKAESNAAYICGTNVVIRSEALDEIGGFPQEYVTEDFAASIKMHHNWKSIFLSDVLATGLGPIDIPSYFKQQRRWATGTLNVLRSNWKAIFLPSPKGLTLAQRIHYLLASTHYLCGVRDFIYIVTPVIFLLTGIPAVKATTLSTFLWHFIPYFLVTSAAFWYAGWGLTGLKGIIIGFGSFPVLVESFFTALIGRRIGFQITPKQKKTTYSWNYFFMYFLFLLLSISCIGLSLQVKYQYKESVYISMLWIIYTLFMFGGFFLLILKDLLFHTFPPLESAHASLRHTDEKRMSLTTTWKFAVAIFICLLFFIPASLVTLQYYTKVAYAKTSPFFVSRDSALPLLGVSLSTNELQKSPKNFDKSLKAETVIVGRTQDISDNFDLKWADTLAMSNKRPWITIEFGKFDSKGQPPLNANLTAISNGVQDDAIKRWADEIHDYGKPVYVTVLLHTDRNWALSSGVANGGIPQDVPRAWEHIQSVFKKEKVTNVAWVWSPADPEHDEQFAPSEKSIDLVLLSLISYPNTKWVDPQSALQGVIKRYPTKPIILEVSASGTPEQKSQWLIKVGAAVLTMPNVYAFIYHEGVPGRLEKPGEAKQWSFDSDTYSLSTMQEISASIIQKYSKKE